MTLDDIRRILIVGAGSSGLAAARLAADRGVQVVITDSRPESELSRGVDELPKAALTYFGEHPLGCLEDVHLVVVSPGVPPNIPLLEAARVRSIPIVSEPEYAWFHRREAPLVAVTGSNGKSTTTVLIATMLQASGAAAVAGGNLGPAASQLVLDGGWETWVLEMSSFQTELLTAMAPQVGVFLNLSQDHLERHSDLRSYRDAKRQLFAFQTAVHAAVLNADDPNVRTTPTAAQQVRFSLSQHSEGWLDGSTLMLGSTPLVDRNELSLAGLHNAANALAAALAARQLGASHTAMTKTLKSFDGLEHRHRTVAIIGGVRWINDSKATNVGATKAALEGYEDKSVHLILGGLAKGQDFSPLAESIRRFAIRLYLIGADRTAIATELAGTVEIEDCATLECAVNAAQTAAQPGETVLLAPACASFDQFSGYAERGNRFSELVCSQEVATCR